HAEMECARIPERLFSCQVCGRFTGRGTAAQVAVGKEVALVVVNIGPLCIEPEREYVVEFTGPRADIACAAGPPGSVIRAGTHLEGAGFGVELPVLFGTS